MPAPRRCTTSKRRSPASSTASGSAAARFISALFRPRIDRILFAATKADHLHHSSHDRLEAVLRADGRPRRRPRRICRRRHRRGGARRRCAPPARPRSRAAARSCRRSSARRSPARPPWRDVSTARPRSRLFPGDLPTDPDELFKARVSRPLRMPRPTRPTTASCASGRRGWNSENGEEPALPHIRLDRAAPVPDRRPTAMSEKTPHRRPATFKLDDPSRDRHRRAGRQRAAPAARHVCMSRRSPTRRAICPVPIDAAAFPLRRGFRWGTLVLDRARRPGAARRGLGVTQPDRGSVCAQRGPRLPGGSHSAAAPALALIVIIAREAFGLVRTWRRSRNCIARGGGAA